MKNYHKINLYLLIILFVFGCKQTGKSDFIKQKVDFAVQQINNSISVSDDPAIVPRTLEENGDLKSTDIYSWTSGFFAGNLWFLYDLTGDNKWMDEAIKYTEALDTIQYITEHHDVGFMINCSYGNGLKIGHKEAYKKVLIQAANSLSTRFNPAVGCIKSWNYRKAWNDTTEWFYPVIIDNMMNLELLFEASLLSGNDKFKEIAIIHAQTTIKNHYRDDYSSYHVVDYDTITGAIKDKATCQGFVDGSSWARGQAWGLYGFVICYRYTKDPQYLSFAENIAHYILNHKNLPEDLIPYWDYNVVDEGLTPEWNYNASQFKLIPRDASAGAITASALFELSKYSEKYGGEFKTKATKMLMSLASDSYQATSGDNKYFILNHSVGSIPHGVEIDVPLVYADYYYLEALRRYRDLSE